VFMDIDSIPFGVDFHDYLDEQLARAEIVLVLVGPDWSDVRDEKGNRRLEDPDDFVRIEIESALRRGITVGAVLIDYTPIPKEEQLPERLRDLCKKQAYVVNSQRSFEAHMSRLTYSIEQHISIKERNFSDTTFNIFLIGQIGLVERELHQRSPLEKLLKPGFSAQAHTVAIRDGLGRVLTSADGQAALAGKIYRIDIPDEFQGANIMKDVSNKIQNADLVVADLYLNRPTVYYEIALAHSLGVPVIILTKKGEQVAFYFKEMKIRFVEDYTAETIAEVLRDPLLAFLAGEDR